MSIVNTLRRAAILQEKIETLRGQLAGLVEQARAEIAASSKEDPTTSLRRIGRPKMLKSSATKARASRERGRPKTAASSKETRRSPLAGRKRASSPSGPLAPAVVKVLRSKGKAMNVRDILAGLTSSGYKFTSPEPKKNLAARIYRLSGVKQVAPGLFNIA